MQIELYFFFFILICSLCTSHLKAPQPPQPPPPHPHSGLSGGWGGGAFTSDTLHAGSPEGGEFAVFASPTKGISGAVTPWSAVFIFVPHGNIAFIIVALIVHILQSALTITINICQYMYLVSLSQIFLFVIVECTSGPD